MRVNRSKDDRPPAQHKGRGTFSDGYICLDKFRCYLSLTLTPGQVSAGVITQEENTPVWQVHQQMDTPLQKTKHWGCFKTTVNAWCRYLNSAVLRFLWRGFPLLRRRLTYFLSLRELTACLFEGLHFLLYKCYVAAVQRYSGCTHISGSPGFAIYTNPHPPIRSHAVMSCFAFRVWIVDVLIPRWSRKTGSLLLWVAQCAKLTR